MIIGSISATYIIFHEIQQFKHHLKIPVFAVIMGIGCSGGYYVANAADQIYAPPTSITGSIGVVAFFPELKGLADKIGYDQVVKKSGEMKDMGNPLEKMPKEERQVMQGIIDRYYERFLDKVVGGRKTFSSVTKVQNEVGDGRIFSAQEALSRNLVDDIAYLDQVINKIKGVADIKHAHIVTFTYGRTKDTTIYSRTQSANRKPGVFNISLPDLDQILGPRQPGFYYLWMGGLNQK